MNRSLIQAYYLLPPICRDLAATVRGWQLRRWRYGPETDDLVNQVLERDQWSPAQWQRWRAERMAFVLHRAATKVPYYRELWATRRLNGDTSSWDMLENWPVLEKESVRRAPEAFIAEDCRPQDMFAEHTSGTTGKSVQLWWSKETVRQWYALFEARSRRWFGVSRKDRWAILGGQLVAPAQSRKPPFWVWNGAMRQLYCSSYHLAPDLIPYYLEALERYKITYLLGYSSALNTLAQEAVRLNWRGTPMKVVITNAEPLFDYQRHAIHTAFQCPVQETYGMAEIVAAANECPHGGLHLWPEAGVTELNAEGELIATGLLNADQPLIRYRVGDRMKPAADTATCACGRALPLIGSVEGRVDDMVYTIDGRAVGRLDPIFKADLPVIEAQIVQESLDCIRLLYVPASNFDDEAAADVTQRIRDRLGPVQVILEPVAAVPRQANGKFRAVINKLPQKPASTGTPTR